jgi:hypothetical protein
VSILAALIVGTVVAGTASVMLFRVSNALICAQHPACIKGGTP